MKNYKITSKVYVSMPVPISPTQSLVIPKKGSTITAQFAEVPLGLQMLQSKGLIAMEEIL